MPKSSKPLFFVREPPKKIEHKFKPKRAGFYDRNPEFSFKYYEHTHKHYSAKCISACEDFHTMFERLKRMSDLTWGKISSASHMYHFHPIDWIETSERHGFRHLPIELQEFPAWQFKNFKECRFIGFFNKDNIFELVWIDREHKVYPCK